MTTKHAPDFGLDRGKVLSLLRDHHGTWGKRELARELNLAAHEKVALKELLRELEHEGRIERTGRKGYTVLGDVPNVGVVEFTGHDEDGDLVGRLAAHHEDHAGPVIRLVETRRRGRESAALGVGDRALARLAMVEDGVAEARVIKKLPRERRRMVGVVRRGQGGLHIESSERGARGGYGVRPAEARDLEDGDLVAFTTESERRGGRRLGHVEEVIGRIDGPHAATILAAHAHGIEDGFAEPEIKEVEALRPATPKGREDLTKIPLLTIDPEDARDHDDAVWAEPDSSENNKGGHVVIVAIADVAAYVRPSGPLDRGAERRGVSTYFPDRVAPMLPERLSTDLCSLKEGEPRPCLAVRMVFSAHGEKVSHRFVRGWMRSTAKLSYEQAQAAIDGAPDEAATPVLESVLKPLWAAYRAVNAARERRNPLEIEAPERRILLDDAGRVRDIVKRERLDAHKLIEEFMIQANVAAAETLEKKRRTFIYRVHEEPSRDKLEALADFLPQVSLNWSKGERATTKRFNALLQRAQKTEHADVVNDMVLRTQSQAVYSTENLGHFGLNLSRYAHFTSPIRRYADLTVHRALIASLNLAGAADVEGEIEARLAGVAERISTAERRAMAAERDAADGYLSAYLAERVGAAFKGRVTGLNRAGCFVRLIETGAEGLAPASRLGEERFIHDARIHALIGERTGAHYRLGQMVEVRLVEATPVSGGLLFDILSEPEQGERPARRGGARPSRAPTRRGKKRPSKRRR